jgi:hypothetical protein
MHNILGAAHIVGGDVTYKCISSNPVTKTTKFTITFTLFRDVAGNGAAFDFNARFGIFESSVGANDWTFKQTIVANPINIETVPYQDECVIVPPSIFIEKANYIFDVELPWSEKVFQINYQRCCRNATISNIINPAETGAAFYVEIFGNSIQECNNSPVFNNFPPILICNQKALNFDHSASDNEGNRLEYEFCAPLHAGGTDGALTPGSPTACTGVTPLPDNCPPPYREVEFGPNYSALNPMGGSPQINIDPFTGIITGVPNLLGQFVVGVCVKEYKNGVQIGSIRREFQFNVVNCEGIAETKNLSLCTGDSIKVNDITYDEPGNYSQIFQSISGCDSTVNINIKGLVPTSRQIAFKICDDETITINDQNYSESGIYTQVLTNQFGCDSTLTINIDKYFKTTSTITIQLCNDETGIVNGIVYDAAGSFTQILDNSNGCDSIIQIEIKKGQSSFEEKTYALCDQNPLIINGLSYSQAGRYTTQLTTTTGCDSILILEILPCDLNILYDLEKCDALVPANSMVYDEFLPAYVKVLECGQVEAKNIYRNNPQVNKHSCTQGFNNSIAMCVGASPSCNYEQVNITPIVIEFKMLPNEGQNIQLNHLIFQQKAPITFSWISGPSGPSDYPTKYGIKILKDNVEIYKKIDVSTTTDWHKEKYDFYDNDLFITSDSATYTIELTPYCPIGNGAKESVWDIDDVSLHFSCSDINNRIISGKIINQTGILTPIEIRRQYLNTQTVITAESDGSFIMPKNNINKDYIFSAYNNDNTIQGLTTLDLVITQRHILGLEPFTNPLQYLAADVNNDRKITASDLVQMRKIILGIDTHFKTNNSWIFLDETDLKTIDSPWNIRKNSNVSSGFKDINNIRFFALKVGDVDGATNKIQQISDK